MQFEFAGKLDLPDGRYLARDSGEEGRKSVLVIETLGAPPPPARRRRSAKETDPVAAPSTLPLSRITAVWAAEPFSSLDDAKRWLDGATEVEDTVDALVAEGMALLNRAMHAQAAASADPRGPELSPEHSLRVRIGYGDGEEVAAGRFAAARDIDVREDGASRRRRRQEELRPQERVAAVLGRRERIDACETMLLRARADLDAVRFREAALQLRVGLEALLVELEGALVDAGHVADMEALAARRGEVIELASHALRGDLDTERAGKVRELIETCERILRRRRVLRGG